MGTLFIADLHLSAEEPAIIAGFIYFLQHTALKAEALYILGDLFEAWIGDDDVNPLHQQIACELKKLHQAGVPCYFIHGNRDFLIGNQFAKQSGMTLLPEEHVVELYGQRFLLLHGDTLCTDDHSYQRFRRKVHNRFIQRLFLALPLCLRLKIAAKMRATSQHKNKGKPQVIMDVNQQAVEQVLARHNVHLMIHGHTHRPAIHTLAQYHPCAQRIVLGAWHQQGSMINVTAEKTELIFFPLQD